MKNRSIILIFIRMRRLHIVLFGLICFLAFPAQATHIVGGEFELVHVEGFEYKINLIQYFDEVNGSPEAEDDFAVVYLFSKRDEQLIKTVTLQRINSRFVEYTNPACAEEFLVTRRILYSANVQLLPSEFHEEEGYFMVYERCCRNNIIENLINPDQTGEAFYMEFPAVVQHEEAFINSSPILSPPVSDYACINQLFHYDFSSVDPDGDSLVYAMVAPFNSSTSLNPLPTPRGAPDREVDFVAGIGVDNMVPGVPPLSINARGELTVKPDQLGVFVFGVRVEEFREGKKIGEIRRDFQMLVVDCNPGNPPEVRGKIKGRPFFYTEGDTVRFAPGEARCLTLFVTDKDPNEQITLKAEGVNFEEDIQHLILDSLHLLNNALDTVQFDICLPECPYTQGPMLFDIIAFDDACSQSLSDTLRFTVFYEGPHNEDPYIENNPQVVHAEIEAGEVYELPLRGLDQDGDLLKMEAQGEGFDLDDYGMSMVEELLVPGEVKKTFRWNADCALYDFSEQDEFTVVVTLSDESECSYGEPDRLTLHLKVRVPANNKPEISFENLESQELTVRIDETINFTVIATDQEANVLTLFAEGDGFELIDYNMNFPSNTGIQHISTPFSWRLSCNNIDLGERSEFRLFFIAKDQNRCGEDQADTVQVTIHVLPPVNEPPAVSIRNVAADTIQTIVGSNVFFEVVGQDDEVDLVTLRLAEVRKDGVEVDRGRFGFNFAEVRAYGNVSSYFSWVPHCEALGPDFTSAYFEVSFVAEDNKCFNALSDTVKLVIQVFDAPLNLSDYEPDNAFTPNGDGFGDFFFLPTLPAGNCGNRFEKIEIYSRWGNLVFSSDELEFRWYAAGVPSGVYYYLVHYSRQIYKNQVYVHLPKSQ